MAAKARTALGLLVSVVLLYSVNAVQDTCDFEKDLCGYQTKNCSTGACFKVARVSETGFGPSVDHKPGTAAGSCAYAYSKRPGLATLKRTVTGPFCFTGWYYAWGTKRPNAYFRSHLTNSYFVIVHSPTMAFTGSWHKVVYPEKRVGTVQFTIAALLDGTSESTTFAVDDLTFKSGPCDPAPKDGSCDFDWGDACGYTLGNGTYQWRIADRSKNLFSEGWLVSTDVSTGSKGGYVHHTAPNGKSSTAVLSSPKVYPKADNQCLRFYYYIAPATPGAYAYGLVVSLSTSSKDTRILWHGNRNSLVTGTWIATQVSFKVKNSFELDFECSVGLGQHKNFFCALDAVRVAHCERPTGNNFQDCDFERGLCTWQNVDTSFDGRSQWTLGGGTIKSTLAKPTKDHTLGKSNGSYIFFSSFQQIAGATSRIVSEPVFSSQLAMPCMEFWYIVAGPKAAKLRVQSIPLNGNPQDIKQMSLLWEAEGGEFDSWKLGRLALSGKTRVIFEGIAAGAVPPGYVALDDISIFPNESCDPSPKNASSQREADGILNCDFGEGSLCKWSFTARRKDVGWLFADMSSPVFSVGPRPLPKGVSGSFIHTNRVRLALNGGSLQLNSMNVPSQSGLWCATLWYHMFGGLATRLEVTRLALQSDAGSAEMWAPFSVLYREGRTITDRWYSVQRTLDMNARSNRLEIRFETIRHMPSETAIGPILVTPGACRAVTESQGWCDFEYEMCGWISNKPEKGWRRKEAKLTGMAADTRSGPVDSQYFMELRGGVGSNNSALFSPWFEGKPEPQCLKFWYKRDSLTLGRIVVEVTTGRAGPRNIVWTQPPYPKNDWMLARIPVSQEKRFQVVISGNITDRRNTQSALGLDDVEVSPEPCKPLLDCGFEDDLCGYVNDYSSEFKWLVGTGRLVRPRLQTEIPKPPSSPTASEDGKSSWTRFAYVDFTVPSGDPFGSETQAPAGVAARLVSPVFDVGDNGDTVVLTYFRKGKAIESMELSQVAYQDNGTTINLVTVQLPEGETWKSISSSLKPSNQSQLVITLKRSKSTDGAAAISVISSGGPSTIPAGESSLSCDFENGTFCGWNATVGVVPFKMNDPANKVPAFPKSDHTLRAFRGRFIYVDSQGKNDAQAGLQSPVIPEKVRDNFCFSFWHLTLPNTRGFLAIYDTVKLHPVWRPLTTVSHHWAHTLFQLKMPAKGDRITLKSFMFNGLLALDDLQITPGSCPEPDKCTFEWGSSCRVYREFGSARFWDVAPSDSLNISDHTLGSIEGHYLYINTTNVDPAHPEARAFLADRKPTTATCLTFWWKGFGTPSDLNIYLHTKETILRDPILSVYTRPTPLWWNVRYVTISSKLTWKLTFEAVSATSKVQSGVLVDDIEFTEGECPSEKLCTFEEDICVPWEQMVTVNASGLNRGWEVQRADQSDTLKKDHTLASGEGYYLMFRSTGNKMDSASLVLRQPRFQCGSLWYFISSKSPNGVTMNVKNRIFNSPTKSWKRVLFNLIVAGEQRIVASAGNDKSAFLAIDDLLVDEGQCKDMVPGSGVLDNFTCSNGDKISTNKVCDFVKDCKDGSDEVDCGACDFKKSTCGWTYPSRGYLPNWQRKRVGEVEGSPKLSAAGLTTGFYMLHQRHPPMDMVISDGPLNGPTIRNTNYACVLDFWYNYNRNNNSVHMDLMMKVNGQQINIWSLRYVYPPPDERTWWHARILLGRYAGDVKLYFVAFGWPWKEGYFAIDEINYAFCGLPPKVASCNVHKFRCANGACISQLQVCNYVDNCGDGSDEVNCGDHNSGCNFDASFCDWKPVAPAGGVNPGWVRKKPSGSMQKQPSRDHTTGLHEGQFLQLDAGSSKVDAEIAGPVLESSSFCTVTFFHTIYGSLSSTLTFGIRYKTGGPLIPLWRTSKPTGFFHFIEAYTAFRPLAPFQVFFRGTHGANTKSCLYCH
uniref:Putative thyroid hormone-induced protein b n=1 Tax=Ixodes ricinus TaxID=34613 RepID=V5H852_IXORI